MANAAVTLHLRHEASVCWRRGWRAFLNFPTTDISVKALGKTHWPHCLSINAWRIFCPTNRLYNTSKISQYSSSFSPFPCPSGSLIVLSGCIHFHGNKATARWQEAGMFHRAPEQEVSQSRSCERQQRKRWMPTIFNTRPGVTLISVSDYLLKTPHQISTGCETANCFSRDD